jgi:hypothetical protein
MENNGGLGRQGEVPRRARGTSQAASSQPDNDPPLFNIIFIHRQKPWRKKNEKIG